MGYSCIACGRYVTSGNCGCYTPAMVEDTITPSPTASVDVGALPKCDDPECGCMTPTFTTPLEALEFLSARFKHAGVSDGVARIYARDIDAILAQQPAAEQANIVGWINEDELPPNYPYDVMFPHSKVDIVRMFPVYAPATTEVNRSDELDRSLDEVMKERDHAYDIIDKLCDAVLGSDRNEWSSAYFFEDAIEEVEDRIYYLTNPPAPAQGASNG